MADKIEIPVEIRPHRFEEVKQQLNTILDPKTLSADAQILFQSVLGSLDIAQAEMTSQMAENKFNIPKLNLKTIDKQLGALIKKVQEDLGQSLPETFVEAQKELEKLNNAISKNQKEQKDLLESIKETPSIADKAKSMAPAGFKKFGIAGDETATLNRVLELEKKISETKDKRKLGPLQAELEYQQKILEIQKATNKELEAKQGKLNMLQGEESKLAAFADVQRDRQTEAMKGAKTDPRINELLKVRQENVAAIKAGIGFQQQYNAIKTKSAALEKKEAQAIKGTTNSIAEKSVKTLGMNIIYQQLRKLLFDSIRTIQQLDKALTDAAIVTSMSRKQTWELIGAYQELAKRTGVATSEIAGVITQFLRQGRSLSDAMELAEVAAKSAKVAGISANEAVTYLTSAVNGFGLSANQAEDIADKFAAIAARSATSFEELAKAMSKVSPTARSAGVSVDFMMGVIAKGIETTREAPENIGTAFKTIFARMREVTDLGKSMEDGMSLNRVEKALLSVNVPLRDVSGQFRNLEDVLIDVGDKWNTLTSVEQAYLATALAGSRQQPRLLAIFNDFARTKELIQISSEATGDLQLQHMEYMTGMEASLSRLKTAWEGFITSIVSADIVVVFFDILSSAVDGVAAVVQAIGPSTSIMIGLVTALGVAYIFSAEKIKAFTTAISENIIVQSLYNKVIALYNFFAGISHTIALARNHTDEQHIRYTKMSVAALILRTKTQASDALITEISTKLQSKNNKERREGIKLLYKTIIGQKIKAVTDFVTAAAQGIYNFMVGKGTVANYKYAASLAKATLGLSLLIPLLIGAVAAIIQFLNGSSKASKGNGLFAKTFGPIIDAFKHFWDMLRLIFKILFDLGKALMSIILIFVGFSVAFSPLGVLLGKLYLAFRGLSIIIKVVNIAIKALSNFISNIIDGIVGFFKSVIDTLKGIPFVGDLVKGLSNIIDGFFNAVNAVDNALTDMNTSLEEFGEKTNKATLELSDFNKGVSNIKRLKDEFDKLNRKASKTPEELSKMQDILKEMSDIEIDGKKFSFATEVDGVFSFNMGAYEAALGENGSLVQRQKEMEQELNSLIDRTVAVYGTAGNAALQSAAERKGAFEEQGVIDAARYLGQQYAKTFINEMQENEQIDDVLAMELLKSTSSAIASAGTSFFNSFVQNGKFQEAGLQSFVESAVTKTKASVESLNNALDSIALNKNMSDRAKATNAIKAQITAYKELEEQLKITATGAREPVAMKIATEFMGDGAILNKLINQEGFSINAIVNMQMSGKSLIEIEDLLVNEFDAISSRVANQGAALSKFNAAVENAFSGTGQGIATGIQAYADLVRQVGFTGDELETKIIKFSNAITTLSGESTASLLEDQRKLNEKLFSLPEKVKKGDFKDYTDLVAEFGLDQITDLLSGKNEGIAAKIEEQNRKTLDGIESSIAKIRATATALNKDLTATQIQEIQMLQTMYDYYKDIVSVEQLRTYRIKEANELLKESGDLIKLQDTLMKFGMSGESPIFKTLDGLIDKTQELAEQKATATLEADLKKLKEFGTFNKDGIFEFMNADTINTHTAKNALDNYMGSLNELANIQNQSYERQKKQIEETFKMETEAIKSSNDEKWKAIEYTDKLAETEEKIAASRRALTGLALSGASSGMLENAQKDLEKMKKERQKMIEQQMVEEAQKQLEAERDAAIQELGQQQVSAMQNLTSAIFDLTEAVQLNTDKSVTTSSTTTSGGTTGGTRGAAFVGTDTVGIF